MYRLENIFDETAIAAVDWGAWPRGKISSVSKVNKTLPISFNYTEAKDTISVDLNWKYHGVEIFKHDPQLANNKLGDSIMQHPLCCGSLFFYGFYSNDTYSYYHPKTREAVRVEIPLAERLALYIKMAKKMGYSTVQYIVAGGQDKIHAALTAAGFKEIHEVQNQRSDNTLHFMQLDL